MSTGKIEIKVQSYSLLFDKKLLRQTLRIAGNEVKGVAISLLKSGGGGIPYHGLNKGKRASTPGTAPASLSGALAGSIQVRVSRSGESVAIRATATVDGAPLGTILEAGAAHNARSGANRRHRGRMAAPAGGYRLAPRPFLTTALDARAASLGPRIQASLANDIKLVRIKA